MKYAFPKYAGVSFGDHQKFTIKWAVGTTIVMTIAALLIGIILLMRKGFPLAEIL